MSKELDERAALLSGKRLANPSIQETGRLQGRFKNGGVFIYPPDCPDDAETSLFDVFSPSSNPEQALELLSEIGKRWMLAGHDNGYTCVIEVKPSQNRKGDAKTPSEAITRAFIKYKEGEKE